jgi:hypothetical protein
MQPCERGVLEGMKWAAFAVNEGGTASLILVPCMGRVLFLNKACSNENAGTGANHARYRGLLLARLPARPLAVHVDCSIQSSYVNNNIRQHFKGKTWQ